MPARGPAPAPPALPSWARPLEAACASMAALLAPYGEVVLHDLSADRVVAVWNPVSGRTVGDASLLGDLAELAELSAERAVIGPYLQTLPDGRPVTAVSSVVPDADGVPRGLLCITVDRAPLDRVAAFATSWLMPRSEPPEPLFRHDWRERIGRRVGEFCAERGLSADRLDPADRRSLIAVLDGEGLFAVRRAADLVAGALGVSRATVYAQLKEIR